MPDTKISALTDGGAVQPTDDIPAVRAGANVRVQIPSSGGGSKYLYMNGGASEVFDGTFDLTGDAAIERVALVGTGGAFAFTAALFVNCTALEKVLAINISSLTQVDFTGSSIAYADIYSNDLTSLVTAAAPFTYLDASTNANLGTVDISANTALLSLYLNVCALTEVTVDGVLADLDAAGLSNGDVDLSGGTNSAPSAAGLISKTSLEGKGWTVTVNP